MRQRERSVGGFSVSDNETETRQRERQQETSRKRVERESEAWCVSALPWTCLFPTLLLVSRKRRLCPRRSLPHRSSPMIEPLSPSSSLLLSPVHSFPLFLFQQKKKETSRTCLLTCHLLIPIVSLLFFFHFSHFSCIHSTSFLASYVPVLALRVCVVLCGSAA